MGGANSFYPASYRKIMAADPNEPTNIKPESGT